MDNWFEAVISPLMALVAFALALAFLYAFRRPLGRLVREFRVAKIGALGFNVEFIESTTVAAYEKQNLGPPSDDDRRKIRDVAAHLAPLAAGSRILWVDNNPAGNRLERAAFREWRIEVQTRRTTDEARAELRDPNERYDLVISDWTRPDAGGPDAEEGLRLLQLLRSDERDVPVVFYHGPLPSEELRERRRRALEAGAVGATGSPGELYQLVLLELVRRALAR